ncbi:MAG TPA: hypothetical protein DDW87_01320, partial [Firmicutes bacterium]|nr:hypothetical protein [Bacillota bacterium]
MVSQSLLENSKAARDPRQPVRESFVPSILGRQTERKVGHVGIASVREASLAERIEALMDSDQRILVFDSATMEDLQTIVGGVASLQKRVLWVGSAGLAQALAKELLPHLRPAATSGQRSFSSPDPVLIVAGSRNQITLEQVDQVVREGQAQLLSVPVDVLKGNGALERYIAEAVCVLKGKRNLAISVRQPSQEAMTREGDLSLKIAASLGQIASNVIRDSSLAGIILAGIILTGGDIAVQTCQRLGITSLQIRGQVAEGIPISLATERSLANVPIVTKAGGFGDRDVFLQAISMLNHKEEQPHG